MPKHNTWVLQAVDARILEGVAYIYIYHNMCFMTKLGMQIRLPVLTISWSQLRWFLIDLWGLGVRS